MMKRSQSSKPMDIASLRKRNAGISAALLAAVVIVFAAAGLFVSDRSYSETENRLLTQQPDLTGESLQSGDFQEKYASYLKDQFAGREKWLSLRTATEIALQKKEFNGVYLGEDGYLLEKHAASAYTEELVTDRLDELELLCSHWNVQVCLVPTADNILTDKLPAYADVYDETGLLRSVWERIGMDHYIDVYNVLLAHQDEALYYRTDEHWTTLGAYYAYLAWTQAAGVKAKALNADNPTIVSDTFSGSLSDLSGLPAETTDSIYYYPLTERRAVSITYDGSVTTNSYYDSACLGTENAYSFYMNGEHAQTEIHAGLANGRTLFVIGDSWANCLLPMIAAHYETVYVVNPSLLEVPLSEYMESCEGADDMEVLVLYSCDGFLEEFSYD